MEEIGFSRYERMLSSPMSEAQAVRDYIRRVANPDYVHPS